MAKHLFLAANCETPGCTAARALKYLGAESLQEFESLIPETFEFYCAECKRWNCDRKKHDVYPWVSKYPPPDGFEDMF